MSLLEHASRPSRRHPTLVTVLVLAILCVTAPLHGAGFTQTDAAAALKRAVEFFSTKVAVAGGGYGYRISDDLTKREGENRTTPTQFWVQPPATPAVGTAYLEAYRLTGEDYLLIAARATAEALIRCQLESGGWQNPSETDPQARHGHRYRVDASAESGSKKSKNRSTLDDNKTQSCLLFLMRLDAETGFRDAPLHAAVIFGLDSLVKVQYPNGAWPQQFEGPPDASQFPVKTASYPDSWSREFPKAKYELFYTFNDNTIADVVALMLEAGDTYDSEQYRASAAKAGDFILAAQMPEPQPAWAQQYDPSMHPVWARKFEPPSISGSESQNLIKLLLEFYRRTADKKYLEPIPRAVAYLTRSRLPDGQLARFYELQTNKPLYFTKDYVLTYDDSDLPTHYGFKVGGGGLDNFLAEYEKLLKDGPPKKKPAKNETIRFNDKLAKEAAEVAGALDERGAWVEDGRMETYGEDDPTRRVIESKTFIKNVRTLARCAAAK